MMQWLGEKLAGQQRKTEMANEREGRVAMIEAHVDVLEERVSQLEAEQKQRGDETG